MAWKNSVLPLHYTENEEKMATREPAPGSEIAARLDGQGTMTFFVTCDTNKWLAFWNLRASIYMKSYNSCAWVRVSHTQCVQNNTVEAVMPLVRLLCFYQEHSRPTKLAVSRYANSSLETHSRLLRYNIINTSYLYLLVKFGPQAVILHEIQNVDASENMM